MNILITGGSGFIGSHLTKQYATGDHKVFVVDNLITGNRDNLQGTSDNNLTFYEADVTSFDFHKLPHIDIAYNLASPASPIQYKKHPIETLMTNAQGSNNLLAFAKQGGCDRVVFSSTSEVYGDPLEHPQTETYWGNVNPVGERSCYDEAKRFVEALAMAYMRKYGLDIRLARIFNTYGPQMEMNDGRVVSNFITQALKGEPITIYGDGSQTRSFCYVSDMVRGLVKLGETADIRGEIINLGNPQEKTVAELAEMIKEMTHSSSDIMRKPIGEDDPKKRKPDITKAKDILNWEPEISLADGLDKTIAYFNEQIHA